ncbi:MAG: GTPase ObgE [Verrucomicrobiae bacterium]|nr:GTPase ObgE [Verrucomicrobiae bacterium]
MFVDRTKIYAKAGDGGNGCMSFRREKFIPHGGPDGGNGGRGGNVILRVDADTSQLAHLFYQSRQLAKRGEHGRGKDQYGKAGPDLIVPVPPGTIVRRVADGGVVADLVKIGEEHILCRGGRGGKGNSCYKSSVNQAPRQFEKGFPGEEGEFALELKLVADIGLVGYPNAGKSTLISKITKAHPKIASYPFTTLRPVIGTIEYEDFSKLRVADIPGLVEGAHQDVGLGHGFLRHIERCRLLVILLDMAGGDGREPWDDYKKLLKELELYNPEIMKKPRLVAANKMDLPEAVEKLPKFKRRHRGKVRPLSAEKGDGIPGLLEFFHEELVNKR